MPESTSMSPTPTMSVPVTSTSVGIIVYSATLADITCEVVNNVEAGWLDKTTMIFDDEQTNFCSHFLDVLQDDQNTQNYLGCYIMKFRQNPSSVQTHITLYEELTPNFDNQILAVLDQFATKVNSPLFGEVWVFGGVQVKPNSCNVTLHPVNVTESQTFFPSLTPSTPVIQPSLG